MLRIRDPRLPPTLIVGLALDLIVLMLFSAAICAAFPVDLFIVPIAWMGLGAVSAALVTHGLDQLARERPSFRASLTARRRWFGLLITSSSISALLYLVGQDSALMFGALLGTVLSAGIHAIAWIRLPFLGVRFGRRRQVLYVATACVILVVYLPYVYVTGPETGLGPAAAAVALAIVGVGAVTLLTIALRVLATLGVAEVPEARLRRG